MKAANPQRWLIIGAFATIYLVWGSTYLANFYAIQAIPPFLMLGGRFLAAGLLLYLPGRKMKGGRPPWRHWRNATLMGFLFLGLGTGGVVWSEQFIDTGLVALIVAFQPLLIVLLLWLLKGKKPGWSTLFGVFLGIAGMVVLVGQTGFITGKETIFGIISIAISLLSWALASLYVNQVELPASRLQATAMQMIGGGICLFIMGALAGELTLFDPQAIDQRALLSWIYLVLFGSILGFSAFHFLLTQVSPDKVSTSNYVNPVVAMLLGWSLNGEVITSQSLLAALLLLGGVVFITAHRPPGERPPRRRIWLRPAQPPVRSGLAVNKSK